MLKRIIFKMKTAILFDLDGTLLDTAPDFCKAMALLRQELNLSPLQAKELELLRLAVSDGVNGMLSVGLPEQMSSLTLPLQDRFLELYQIVLAEHSVYFEGMEQLLHNLEKYNIPWGVVTNKSSLLTHKLLNALHIDKRTKIIVSGDTTPFSKPHPEPLLYAARSLNLDPKHCLYIGDAERDIVAGKAAGMTTMAALFGYVSDHEKARKEWLADHYVLTAHDIFPWIESVWLPKMDSYLKEKES